VGVFHTLLLAAAVLLTAGCTPKTPLPLERQFTSSHLDIPFLPPRSELCAAAAIEMVAAYWQSKGSFLPRLSGTELEQRTLLPAKGGTLQAELAAAARSNGLLVYPLEPSFHSLFQELSAGHPVIVLVNRGLSWYPLWHYAPVTGYDARERTLFSHLGEEPDEAIPLRTFAALWERSEKWGVVLLPPGELPATARPGPYLRAAYSLEQSGMREEALTAYRRGLEQWPNDTNLLFALANAHYSARHLPEAERVYRELLKLKPGHPLARNNLADLLCRSGRPEEALRLLEGIETEDPGVRSVIEATRKEIEQGCAP
jgi:tetratricopeptide (TPR) repeat protein